MAGVYRTKSGDVWDGIAREVYGDEAYLSFLMANNQEYLEYFVFPEGIYLRVEELPEEKNTLPDWRN
ncbi:MAG: phage tail protein [Lachnospiraceae bacterium]|nr:phage tail protein [Lachnospiraceae bacterium]